MISRWDDRDRTALAIRLDANEVAVVSSLGCELKVLTQCDVAGGYRTSHSVYALDRGPVRADELEGDCAWATHAVTRITVDDKQTLVAAELTPLSLDGYSITGTWRGVMRQPGGPYEVYNFTLGLVQNHDRVSGISRIRTIDGAYWGEFRFEGRLEGNTLFFADVMLIDDNLAPLLGWCDKGGYLVVDPRGGTLRGPWRAFACSPGEIRVQHTSGRSDGPSVATNGAEGS